MTKTTRNNRKRQRATADNSLDGNNAAQHQKETTTMNNISPDADLTEVDLTGADLTGKDLSYATFYRTNLTGADLTGADLRGVRSDGIVGTPKALPAGWVLANGYLVGEEAYLEGAYLRGADLTAANLTNADLTLADLRETNLPASFAQATTDDAWLSEDDLDV